MSKLQTQIQDSIVWGGALAAAEALMLQGMDLTSVKGRWSAAASGLAIFVAAMKNFPDLSNPPKPTELSGTTPVPPPPAA